MRAIYNVKRSMELVDMSDNLTGRRPANSYDPDREIEAEVCQSTINKLAGYWSAEHFNESQKPNPDHARIRAIESYRDMLDDELRALEEDDPYNQELMGKSKYIYAPILRALFAKHD